MQNLTQRLQDIIEIALSEAEKHGFPKKKRRTKFTLNEVIAFVRRADLKAGNKLERWVKKELKTEAVRA